MVEFALQWFPSNANTIGTSNSGRRCTAFFTDLTVKACGNKQVDRLELDARMVERSGGTSCAPFRITGLCLRTKCHLRVTDDHGLITS